MTFYILYFSAYDSLCFPMSHSFLLPQWWNLPLLPVNRGTSMQVFIIYINKFIWQYKLQWYIDATDAARDSLVKDVNSRKRWSSSLQLLKVFVLQTLLTQSSPLASGCGAYGYDINQLCAAWTEAPEEMTREQYQVTPNNLISLFKPWVTV